MAKKIVEIPDDKLNLLKEMILLMGGTEKDAEKSDIVADDSIVKAANELLGIFNAEKLSTKGLSQQDVDRGRELVENLVDFRIKAENELFGLLTPEQPLEKKDAEDKADAGCKLVKELAKLPYNHPRANIAVDVVVFGILPGKDELHVFVQRDNVNDKWALPGRFMRCGSSFENEINNEDGKNWTLEETMRDALVCKWEKVKDKTETYVGGVKVFGKESEADVSYTILPNMDFICQLEPMSALDRDKRETKPRVVSIPYMTLIYVKNEIPSTVSSLVAQWKPVSELIKINENYKIKERLAHDHSKILTNALKRLFQEVRTRPIGGSWDVVRFIINKEKKEIENKESELEKVVSKYMCEENKDNIDDYFLLPSEFDVAQLIDIYNVVLHTMGVSVERSNLKKLLLIRGVIKEVGNRNQCGKGSASFRFVAKEYNGYKERLDFGFNPKPKNEG